ncbi:hypothetical protein H4Q26_015618 [Puccinia striiformis f. sp. tritici PST-130]|nr:hypothetical protein H4Q26_015618 [Puccinia striiformis f. sp. tritici PST-130]
MRMPRCLKIVDCALRIVGHIFFCQSRESSPTLRTVQSGEESDGRKDHSTLDELARQQVRDLAGILLHSLQVKFSEASEELYSSCFEASSLIEHMKLSPEEFNRRTDKSYLGFYTQDAIDSVKSAVGYITESDLDFAQSRWKGHLEQINSVLWEIEAMVKPGTYMGYEDVTGDITELRYLLCIAEAADPAANGQKFVQVAEDFKSRFDALLLVVNRHLIPSVPDTDRFQDRKYFRDWFMTWDIMRISATKELMNAAKSLDDHPT